MMVCVSCGVDHFQIRPQNIPLITVCKAKKIELQKCNSILVVDRGIEPLCQD